MSAEQPEVEVIPGQLTVDECIALAESEPAHKSPPGSSGHLTPAQAVRAKLKAKEKP